jgi:transposase
MCFEGTLTGAVFLQFLDEFLVPVLKPGQIVILDNAKAHKVAGVRERIEGAGARVLYLPPYSPDLNPIEMAWSKLSSSCAKPKRAPWRHFMRRSLRPYKPSLQQMPKASSSMSDFVYDPCGNRYKIGNFNKRCAECRLKLLTAACCRESIGFWICLLSFA